MAFKKISGAVGARVASGALVAILCAQEAHAQRTEPPGTTPARSPQQMGATSS